MQGLACRELRKVWDWECRIRTSCTVRSPNLTLEVGEKKEIILIEMACPKESNKT
jgi:hypothetical protein